MLPATNILFEGKHVGHWKHIAGSSVSIRHSVEMQGRKGSNCIKMMDLEIWQKRGHSQLFTQKSSGWCYLSSFTFIRQSIRQLEATQTSNAIGLLATFFPSSQYNYTARNANC